MKKALSIMAAITVLLACVCITTAKPKYNRFDDKALGTNTSASATINIVGYVDTVYVSVSDGISTGTVSVAYVPHVGTGIVSVATGTVTREKVWRPVVALTSVTGTNHTAYFGQFPLVGETLTFSVSGSPTGVTWKCLVVTEDGK